MSFKFTALAVLLLPVACASSGERRFPLRDPLWQDTDLRSVNVRCRQAATEKDPRHVTCAPEPYDSPLYWDAADNIFFRPLSDVLGLATSGEAINVNSLDEVPDSAWFTNRAQMPTTQELKVGACSEAQLLDPDHAADGSWIVDKGKGTGSTPGFRINVPGKGKYLVKVESLGFPERQVAATVIGEAVYHAAGYYATCEQALYVRPSVFKLMPGLKRREGNFGDVLAFDQSALDAMLATANKRGNLVRVSASAWLPGYVLGQFRYEGTRADDPNDVIPHEDRRELRGARLLVAWIDWFDAREGNSLDTWMADAKHGPPDASPGHVIHYQQGTSAALGSTWGWVGVGDDVSKRLGTSYLVDWGDIMRDFFTLGIPLRPWDRAKLTPGRERFGYMNIDNFMPDHWKNEYPNAAFSRMTERDGAWIARILSRFTPAMIRTLAEMGKFSDKTDTDYLEHVLEGRLDRILDRYLTRLSPIAEVRVEDRSSLCGVDLAERSGVRPAERFRYTARSSGLAASGASLAITHRASGEVCVALVHVAHDGGARDDAPERYLRVTLFDGVAKNPLVAHLYDVGETRGFKLAGVERPDL